jgi:hypothetical protein
MKIRHAFSVSAIALSLGLGLGASVSAADADPLCLASCQEQLNDCRAQAQDPKWISRHCNPIYRACVASCQE